MPSSQSDNMTQKNGHGLVWVSRDHLLAMQNKAQALVLGKGKIRSRQIGHHLSPFKGRGMDFAESRPYQAGDDIRTLDWRVTARTNRPHTKVFQEERERPVIVWIDMRENMFFATQGVFKSVVAAEIAALLAWKTRAESDRIGAMLAMPNDHLEFKPSNTRKGLVRFLQKLADSTALFLNDLPSSSGAHLADHWRRLRRVVNTGSRVYLLSDFRQMDKEAQRQLIAIKRKADVVLINISDPFENKIDDAEGEITLQSLQGNQKMRINLQNKRWLGQYSETASRKKQALKAFCQKYRLPLVSISTKDGENIRLQKLANYL